MRSWRTLSIKSSVALPASIRSSLALLTAATMAWAADKPTFDRSFLERAVPKYPHHDCPSLLFYNLVETYKIPGFLGYVTDQFADVVRRLNPDYVAAPEARALPVFGAVSLVTGKPGLFIRKAGKLPQNAPLIREDYRTAYADSSIEMVADPALRGKTVVILDDGLSSGGTTLATIRLLERQGMRVLWVLAMIEYHYKPRVPEYAPWYPKTTTLFDLAKPLPLAMESVETERKFQVPDLRRLPDGVHDALVRGESHRWIRQRGYVLQEYLPLDQLNDVVAALRSNGIPFGTAEEQAEVIPIAKEVRLSTKSLRVRVGDVDERRNSTQITVKGPGGLSVRQLETPEGLSTTQQGKLAAIVDKFQAQAKHRVRKAAFEIALLDADGVPRKRPDGADYTVEVDIYLRGEGDARYVEFASAEVEFHGATLEIAAAEGLAFHPTGAYFGNDLTGAVGVKARDIAANGVPEVWADAMAGHRETNDRFLKALIADFDRWAEPALVARMLR